jgi:ParB family chromosome partitioning protein
VKEAENAALNVRYLPIDTLIPYARNARTHTDEQVAQLAASLREFGWTNPVLVDGDAGIIAGHGRVLAARKLGMPEVPCISLAHLTPAQRRAYVMADNKLAEAAGWDSELLAVELADLKDGGFDLSMLGFTSKELADALAIPDFHPGSEDEQGRLDVRKPIVCPSCGHEF